MSHRSPLIRILAGLLAASLLAACSMATIAYNNAGSLIGFVLSDYAELTEPQEAWVRDRLTRHIAWHRASELPKVHRQLLEARDKVAGQVDEADLRDTYLRAQALLNRTTEQLLPDLVELLRQAEPQQIEQLQAKFDKDNRKMTKEAALPMAERRARRLERTIGRFEDWLGTLTPEQAAHIEARMGALAPLDELRLIDRIRWQRDFIRVLRGKPSAEAMEAELRILLMTPEVRRHPPYQAEWLRQQQEMNAATAWVLTRATPAQRARVQKKLSGYAGDIASLMRS